MYSIREATPEDLTQLPVLERAAAQLFRASPYPEFADGPLAIDSLLPGDRVWVVANETSLAGFAITRSTGNAIHIQEIDVHPDHARQGLGRRLIEFVAEWTRSIGLHTVTLTTMSDVPWNAPYYARLGFEPVEENAITDELRKILQAEAEGGIPMHHRICMQLRL